MRSNKALLTSVLLSVPMSPAVSTVQALARVESARVKSSIISAPKKGMSALSGPSAKLLEWEAESRKQRKSGRLYETGITSGNKRGKFKARNKK